MAELLGVANIFQRSLTREKRRTPLTRASFTMYNVENKNHFHKMANFVTDFKQMETGIQVLSVLHLYICRSVSVRHVLCGTRESERKKESRGPQTAPLRYLSAQILGESAEVKERRVPRCFHLISAEGARSARTDCQPAFNGKIARVISRD